MEARWHERIKNYLKTDDESLSEGYFVSHWIGDQLTRWLRDNGWTDPSVHELKAIGKVGLWSPDRRWSVHFDRRSDGYTLLQLIPAQELPLEVETQESAAALVEVGAATLSPKEAVERLLPHFMEAADVVSESKAVYRRQMKQFALWLLAEGRPLGQVSRQDILSYKDHLLNSGKAASTVNNYLVAVRRLFEWLESLKIYPNVARGVKGMKKARNFKKDCLTPAQSREALSSIETSTLQGKRDYALLNLLLRTGLRTIEVARAKVGDLRQEAGEAVLWIQGKGRDEKDDFVLLTSETLKPLKQYLRARGQVTDDDPLFASVSDRSKGSPLATRSIRWIVKEILRSIDLDSRRLSAHSFRHTAVTLAIRGGASLQQVQAMARHSDPRTTLIYFHNLDRISHGAERFIQF